MSHVTCMEESCRTYQWVMSHISMSHVAHMNTSRNVAYEKVVWSCIWMRCLQSIDHIALQMSIMNGSCQVWSVTHVHDSRHKHLWISHITVKEYCYTNERVMPHIWKSRVAHINKSCCTYEWVMSQMNVLSHIWTRHVQACQTCRQVISHISTCNVTHIHQQFRTYKRESDLFNCVILQMYDVGLHFSRFPTHVWMSHITRINKSCHT